MTYAEKLRSPLWQRKRLQILERDQWRCRSCSETEKPLQVHHIVYRRLEPWDYPDYCYRSLCADCHKERQEITDKLVDALRLSLADVPTIELERTATRIMAQAMQTIEGGVA